MIITRNSILIFVCVFRELMFNFHMKLYGEFSNLSINQFFDIISVQNFGFKLFTFRVRSIELFKLVDSRFRKSDCLLMALSTFFSSTTSIILGVALRYLYHQYSNISVTQAIPIPTKMTMNTPPMFWMEIPSD